MNQKQNQTYKIAKSSLFVFLGMLVTSFLQFAVGIVVIRSVSKSEYGLISLAIIIINVLILIGTMGFNNGLPRLMAMSLGNNQSKDFNGLVISALMFASLVSIILWCIVCINADLIAELLRKKGLKEVLNILSLTVTPMTMIFLLTAIFRGHENVIPKIFFQEISLNVIKLVLVIFAFTLGLKFKYILWFYVLPVWCALIFYLIYSYKKKIFTVPINYNWKILNKLIIFSCPLLFVAILGDFMDWSATLMLGFFHSASDVGLYNAPRRFVVFLSMPLVAAGFIYLPLATKVFITGDKHVLIELYQKSTKWIFILTLPLLLYFILDAEYVVTMGLGEGYSGSANILRLLSLGFSIHNFLGPNGMTLMSCGKNKMVLLGSIFSCVFSIIFNLLLVPEYGAIATAWSVILSNIIFNIIISLNLFRITGCQPFTLNYIKPVIFSSFVSTMVYLFINPQELQGWFSHLSLFVIIAFFSILSPIVTKSLEQDEIALLKRVLQQVKMSFKFI